MLVNGDGTGGQAQGYMPWGETRYGGVGTEYQYTGQYRLAALGLDYYGARWYDPSLGRFVQADSVVPDSQNSLDYDRYSYVRNNPLNYSDPTGHLPKEEKPVDDWNFFYWQKQERDKKESWWQRQNRLFSYLFLGSGENGTWTQADWVFYYKYRDELWSGQMDWIHPDPVRGWGAFALHVERLASYYSASEKDQFVKDFALVFAGINTTKSFFGATWGSRKRPELPFLNEGNIGLSKEYLDSISGKSANQSHHYAAIFYVGYFGEPEPAMLANWLRDTNNAGDINLGNTAAYQAYFYHYYFSDPSRLAGMISSLMR